MKEKILKYMVLLLLPVLATECTHNNGDIGHLFGQWKLDEVLINGEPLPDYEGNVYWSFQNSTICLNIVNERESSLRCYGNWREADNTLFVDFPDNSNQDYHALQAILMSRNTELKIIESSGGRMVLQNSPDANTVITYKFRKW